jgi:hypothetical protein
MDPKDTRIKNIWDAVAQRRGTQQFIDSQGTSRHATISDDADHTYDTIPLRREDLEIMLAPYLEPVAVSTARVSTQSAKRKLAAAIEGLRGHNGATALSRQTALDKLAEAYVLVDRAAEALEGDRARAARETQEQLDEWAYKRAGKNDWTLRDRARREKVADEELSKEHERLANAKAERIARHRAQCHDEDCEHCNEDPRLKSGFKSVPQDEATKEEPTPASALFNAIVNYASNPSELNDKALRHAGDKLGRSIIAEARKMLNL